MTAKFQHVAWVTFAVLALIVVSMIGLNAVGVAQVMLDVDLMLLPLP